MIRKLLIALLFVSSSAYAQWDTITPPAGTLNVYSVYAITANAVAIAGDQKVSRSIDGGATWTTPLTITGAYIYEVHSPEPTPWYALTSNTTWFIKMHNPSGVTASNGKPDSILSLHFISVPCGIAVGIAGKIETTCDTGTTWQPRLSGVTSNLNAVWFANSSIGCAVGSFGTITRTVNSGVTWNSVLSPVGTALNAIHFPSATVGYIAGSSGTFLKSIDGGATWTSIPAGVPNNLNGVFFTDTATGYVCGSGGLIMKTVDGGTSWSPMTTPTAQTLNSIHFPDPTVGYAVGMNATILKYDNTAACSATISASTSVSCNGLCDGSAVVTSTGVAPYTYSWMPSGGNGQTASNLCAGTYTVVVTDSTGCTATAYTTITEPPVLSAVICGQTAVECYGEPTGCAYVCPSGGTSPYTYSWEPSGLPSLDTLCGLNAGTYTVTVTDANGCTTTSSVTITQPDTIVIQLSGVNISCNGFNDGIACVDSITGGTPPYIYVWSTGSPSTCISGLGPGQYSISVYDTNGCSTDTFISIFEPPPLILTDSVTDATCSTCCDGSMVPTVTGGVPPYTYTFSCGPAFNVCPGTYVCCVMDANGCSACDTVVISYPSSVSEITEQGFSIHPNPATHSFTISIEKETGNKSWELELLDVTGRLVRKESIDNSQSSIIHIQFISGLYFVKLISEERVFLQKLIIE
jgi:hypothetical protein